MPVIASMDYLVSRWKHFRECWERARHHRAVAVGAFGVVVYSVLTTYVEPLVEIPRISIPKLPLPWALTLVFLALFFIVLEGSYRLHKQATPDEFDEQNPRIVPECRWAVVRFDDEIFQERPITLVNRGGSDAKDIQMAPIVTAKGRAEFKPVGYLAKEKFENVLPQLEGITVNGISDIVSLLDREWQFPKNADPIRQGVCIQYSASVGKGRFMTTGMIVRDPNTGTTEFHNLNFRKIPQAAS
jgi:hypothetical protein